VTVQGCGDVLTKKKLDGHRNQCYGASFTCLDCMIHFTGTSYKSHTVCIMCALLLPARLFATIHAIVRNRGNVCAELALCDAVNLGSFHASSY
jgi:hypothetical protein